MNPCGAEVLNANLNKWKTLPAGLHRCSVNELVGLDDTALAVQYQEFVDFWEENRGWEYDTYGDFFRGRSVLELGSGLGYDGIRLSRVVKRWTFTDIIPENVALVRRLCQLQGVKNSGHQLLGDVFTHDFGEAFDGLYAHGVLHHIPFEQAKAQVANVGRFLAPGARCMIKMYPFERWEACGKPPFEQFGCCTDGPFTPWAEPYDEPKIQELFGPGYALTRAVRWGAGNIEFINFELAKQGV